MATASVSGLGWIRRSERRAFVLVTVGVAGAVATGLTAWAVARSPILVDPTSVSIWRSLIVALYVVVGLYTWWRRPDSRLGPLLVGNGFLYAATSFNASGAPAAYTLGMVLWAVYVVYTAYLLLSYPRGRLGSGLERAFIRAYALSTAALTGLTLVLSPTFPNAGAFNDCGTRCPGNALVGGNADIGTALNTASSIVFTIALIGLTMLLFNKARASGPVLRHAVTPVAAVFIATVGWFVISLYLLPAYPGTESAVRIVDGVLGLAVPMAILLGQVWGDRFAAISLSQIAVRARGGPLTPAGVQKMLGDALGDESLALALWDSDRSGYVDVYGGPLELPRTSERAISKITENGSPVAALIHDPALDTDSDVVEGMAATSMMLLENTRLVEELRASRARIVETAERERQRIERDLHDGAQQRLVAALINLSLAGELAVGNPELQERVSEACSELEEGLAELRDLAHGIYPQALGRWGLRRAFDLLAARYPDKVEITEATASRFPPEVEAPVYYCCLEAVQNASKHAGPDAHVLIRLYTEADELHLEVRDNGTGFDVSTGDDGVGLQNIRDRLGAIRGSVEIASEPGHGTIVSATAPLRRDA